MAEQPASVSPFFYSLVRLQVNVSTPLNQLTDDEVLRIVEPMMDSLMTASGEMDWERHTEHFTEKAKSIVTRSELERQCKEYQSRFGHFAEREILGLTRHTDYINVLWKQRMTGSSGEYLAVFTLVIEEGRYRIARCWVDLWTPKHVAKKT